MEVEENIYSGEVVEVIEVKGKLEEGGGALPLGFCQRRRGMGCPNGFGPSILLPTMRVATPNVECKSRASQMDSRFRFFQNYRAYIPFKFKDNFRVELG